jgi:peptide/nickel transport system ATP-binding protein
MERSETGEVFLSARGLVREFGTGNNKTIAVNNVDFDFRRGEIISIVGESGSGKTTLAKMVLGLLKPTGGEIIFEGKARDISSYAKRRLYWRNIQAIFQDPFSTYNIFRKVDSVLDDCLRLQNGRLQSGRLQNGRPRGGGNLSREEKFEKMKDACGFVNLKFEELSNKYPFELSGGQMQRLMIARIFMLHPKLLIADEPTSMIDACSRATILDMLLKLRDEINMTIVFITHDIGLAYYISDMVYIMERGIIVERGTADEAILHPSSDYTKRLLGDVPKIYEPWNFAKAGA